MFGILHYYVIENVPANWFPNKGLDKRCGRSSAAAKPTTSEVSGQTKLPTNPLRA